MKVSARAYAIQGLVKYHGLRNLKLRLPFHDSISVCAEALSTTATIEFDASLAQSTLTINDGLATLNEFARAAKVVESLQKKARSRTNFRLATQNSIRTGKGLGFSAAAFAAIGLAAANGLGIDLGLERLSEHARLGAGSAARSVVGGISIWYANRGGRSYGHQLSSPTNTRLAMAVVPVAADIKTEDAHREVLTSPFFRARLTYVKGALRKMIRAVKRDDIPTIGHLAELDTLNLHAVTMTGKSGALLMRPESLKIIQRVLELREKGVPAWYSLDTGPSVFVNTDKEHVDEVVHRIREDTGLEVIQSQVGGAAHMVEDHLF